MRESRQASVPVSIRKKDLCKAKLCKEAIMSYEAIESYLQEGWYFDRANDRDNYETWRKSNLDKNEEMWLRQYEIKNLTKTNRSDIKSKIL